MSQTPDPYRIFDELDPLPDETWALHPSAPVVAMIVLPAPLGVAVSILNSYRLRHPRRARHASLGAAPSNQSNEVLEPV